MGTGRDSENMVQGETLAATGERVSLERSAHDVLSAEDVAARYTRISPLGEGGMGEVWLRRDRVIGRDVAMKNVRPRFEMDELARERFLREARVQGQLEHPSIVPVYDLGRDDSGRLYFTMRRIHGTGLDVAARLLTRHALLAALGRVALTVDFAHAHGVIHRDLKPTNLMVGDYGEVYVLDWGVARLSDARDLDAGAPTPPTAASGTGDSLLGTPGYMAPEQARGVGVDARAVGKRSSGSLLVARTQISSISRGTSAKGTRDEMRASAPRSVEAMSSAAVVPPWSGSPERSSKRHTPSE